MAGRRQVIKSAFLDSSVLFSATSSPIGGSAKLFTEKRIRLCTSTLVLTETERNIRKKLQYYHLERFFMLVGKLIIITKVPTASQIEKAEGIIHQKDTAILASAKGANVDYLITLDQRHFLTNNARDFISPTIILTPRLYFNKKLFF